MKHDYSTQTKIDRAVLTSVVVVVCAVIIVLLIGVLFGGPRP